MTCHQSCMNHRFDNPGSVFGALYVDGSIPWYTEEKPDRIKIFEAMNLKREARVFKTMLISFK